MLAGRERRRYTVFIGGFQSFVVYLSPTNGAVDNSAPLQTQPMELIYRG